MNINSITRQVLCTGILMAASSVMAASPTVIYEVQVSYEGDCSLTDDEDCAVEGLIAFFGVFPENTGLNIGGLPLEGELCVYTELDRIPGKTAYAQMTCELPPSSLVDQDDGEYYWFAYDLACGDARTIQVYQYEVTGKENKGWHSGEYVGQRGVPQGFDSIPVTFLGQQCLVEAYGDE